MKRFLPLLALSITGAWAQNSDLGLLAGISGPESQVSTGSTLRVSGSVGASGQINYAWQALSTRHGDLYVELPLVISGHASATVGAGVVALNHGAVYFTPGVRFKLPLQSRVAVYGALGGGLGSFGAEEVRILNETSVITRRTTTGVLDFGGGLDFRITRLLSLRGEVRDFVSRGGLPGAAGRNHTVVQLGLGLHF